MRPHHRAGAARSSGLGSSRADQGGAAHPSPLHSLRGELTVRVADVSAAALQERELLEGDLVAGDGALGVAVERAAAHAAGGVVAAGGELQERAPRFSAAVVGRLEIARSRVLRRDSVRSGRRRARLQPMSPWATSSYGRTMHAGALAASPFPARRNAAGLLQASSSTSTSEWLPGCSKAYSQVLSPRTACGRVGAGGLRGAGWEVANCGRMIFSDVASDSAPAEMSRARAGGCEHRGALLPG